MFFKTSLTFFIIQVILIINGCIPKDYGNGGTVCVCTEDYCDEYDPVVPPEIGTFFMYTSSKNGLRFQKIEGNFSDAIRSKAEILITIESRVTFQKIFGFGGAFTDSTGININSLNDPIKERLLNSYFSTKGIEYNLCRVPIGGTDFSTRPYTYDDIDFDENLLQFNLTMEDRIYKIPLIQKAMSLSKNNLKLVGSAWSAPAWMKTNKKLSGFGFLLTEYYQTWVDYHVKFLDAYEEEGIEFWGITTGNEPLNGFLPMVKINSIGWFPSTQSKWIAANLGPTIRNSIKYRDLKIITLDDQRFFLTWWTDLLFNNESTKKFVDGIAVHWYWDDIFPPSILSATHKKYPEKFILATEACVGSKFYEKKVELGSWYRGEKYLRNIIQDVNNWSVGWVDWNMALNPKGGPTYIENFVDSPIIVNETAQEFYKQPMYYALGHFSKFIPRGSVRVQMEFQKGSNKVEMAAFLRPDNLTAIVLLNSRDEDTVVNINDKIKGALQVKIAKRSFNTIIY